MTTQKGHVMNDLVQQRTDEIIRLHGEIVDSARMTVEKAIRAGKLLAEQKAALPHGSFADWTKDNLPFTMRTAQRYMKAYQNRALLKNDNVSHLNEAHGLLTKPKPAVFSNERVWQMFDEFCAKAETESDNAVKRGELDKALDLQHIVWSLCEDILNGKKMDTEPAPDLNSMSPHELLEYNQKIAELKLDRERELGGILNEVEKGVVCSGRAWELLCKFACLLKIPASAALTNLNKLYPGWHKISA